MSVFSHGSSKDIMRAMESLISRDSYDQPTLDTLILIGSELKTFWFDGTDWRGTVFMCGDLYLLKPADGLLFLICLPNGLVPLNQLDKDDFPEHRILSFEPSSLSYNCTMEIGTLGFEDGQVEVDCVLLNGGANNRSTQSISHFANLLLTPPIDG